MVASCRTSVGKIPRQSGKRNLSAPNLNSDRAANEMENRNTEQSLTALRAVTGP
jgi:hypothetical protein